jgi:hypothetical protein
MLLFSFLLLTAQTRLSVQIGSSSDDWLQFIPALAAAVAAFSAVGIACWQGSLQKQAIKHALFDKRHSIYVKVREYLAEYTKDCEITLEKAIQFLRDTRDTEWLFASEVKDFVEDVYKKSINLRSLDKIQRQRQMHGESLSAEQYAELQALEMWLGVTAHDLARERFDPYLKLHGRKRKWNVLDPLRVLFPGR